MTELSFGSCWCAWSFADDSDGEQPTARCDLPRVCEYLDVDNFACGECGGDGFCLVRDPAFEERLFIECEACLALWGLPQRTQLSLVCSGTAGKG